MQVGPKCMFLFFLSVKLNSDFWSTEDDQARNYLTQLVFLTVDFHLNKKKLK